MLDLIRAGQAYSLDDGTYCYYLGDDGWGEAQPMRITSRAAQQHGHTDHGYRLVARNGSLLLGIQGSSLWTLQYSRAAVLSLFSPTKPIALRWTIEPTGNEPYTVTRQIDCQLAGDLSMPSRDRHGFYQEVAVSLVCPDPSFYDPEMGSVDFGLGGGASSFVIPMPVPHGVGASALNETIGIEYPGSWYSWPQIRIEGPITNPVITNLETGEKLDFTGTTIVTSDYYDIDTAFGQKTVIDKNGDNKIAKLTSDSDLATFHLEPETSNSIKVTGSSVAEATVIRFKYYKRYIGI